MQTTALTGLTAAAGCLVFSGDDGATSDSTPTRESSDADGTASATATERVTFTDLPSSNRARIEEWMSLTEGFDGTVTDLTDRREVTVKVGAEGNRDDLAFDPNAIRVSRGTSIRWEWTGEGGAHNVVGQDGELNSGDPVSEAGIQYEVRLREAGTFLYACEIHKPMGMCGVVIVE